MKKRRERLDAEMADIQSALLSIGADTPARTAIIGKRGDDRDKAKRMTVTSGGLMATAYQLAGCVVATLAIDRSIPEFIPLREDAEYDLGRCSESDLDTIWEVGNLAAERRRDDGTPAEPGRTVVIVKIEGDVTDTFHVQRQPRAAGSILDEHWDDIVHVARLLIDKGTLSRDDIEAEVLETNAADENSTAPSSHR
jgi:hypothetical protein